MTTAKSDSENALSDNDDMMDDSDDDAMNGMNEDDEDDFCEFEDIGRLTKVRDSILGKKPSGVAKIATADIPVDYSIRLAMNSESESSSNSGSYKPMIDDSLRMYLNAPPLIRKVANTDRTCVSIDPTADESQSDSLSTPELYVGNITSQAKWYELRDWFSGRGHGVSRVNLKTNRKSATYAFVRFDSIATARDVLYLSEAEPNSFFFQRNMLVIKRKQRSPQQQSVTNLLNMLTNNLTMRPDPSFNITDIYYGTVITGAAMKNLQRTRSIIANDDKYGIIAHRLMNSDVPTAIHLDIDINKSRIAIITTTNIFDGYANDISTKIKFEWNFQDLKGRKITPVLIHKKQIYLLLEVKRPPIILETRGVSGIGGDASSEVRLPGTVLIGHANAWLFRLSATNPRSDYKALFATLHRYNLSPRQFTGENILHLMSSEQAVKKNFDAVQLVSNDDWVEQNQKQVDDFFTRRWPSYPFETKFEIMKLISKHIITVNDLIVDEQAEDILKLCTTNTLVALTDRILDFAPQWFATTCDYEDEEDWNTDIEQEQQAEPDKDSVPFVVDDVPIINDATTKFPHILTNATGTYINNGNATIPSLKVSMTKHSSQFSNYYLGTFSRLLLNALEQLIKSNQLRSLEPSGVFATRLELRSPNAHSSLIRKIYITPSTVLYEGPYREEKCAVTRHYEQYQDRFLRLTFRDEDYRILHDYNDNMSKMYERIKDILKLGVNICDRNYQFLAFSSSQLREHSCWMFAAPNRETTVEIIRGWMGDFRHVHPVAKYAARLGQLFSTSMRGLKLQSNQFKSNEKDIEAIEYIDFCWRKHCFTDGIGVISTRLAKKLAEEIRITDGQPHPSAFQIRCGGFKGMLCVDIFNRIKEANIDIYFRPSMAKFPTTNFSIDVVRTSHNPTVAFLNRQIILLLSALGIPDQNFIDLQNHMLEQLSALMLGPVEAIRALRELNEFGGNGFHPFLIAYMRRLGRFKDPFVWRLLHVIKAFLIKELRTKTKIRVQDSWSLLGVVDESEILNYGQVFIQIDNSHQQKENPTKEIFRGPVIVTRNPCFHPGDIRKLEAVDLPEFHDLKNVIVFPQKAPRPHPKEMSGGDLDGDTFWITRHPKLIFSRDNESPFDYQGQEDEAKQVEPPSPSGHKISEVCNFFGEYIAADNLGLIANSHLVFADQLPGGALNEKCLTLARMHSTAVDFAKNGVSAPKLTSDLRPKEYPTYMEKKDKPSYLSKTVLGILYDQVKFNETNFYIDEAEEIEITSSFPYQVFFVDDNDNYFEEAGILKNDYDRDIRRIMRQYGIRNEVEFVSGYILKFTCKQYMRETKLFDLRNEITHAYRAIQDKYLHLFWQEFYQSTNQFEDDEPLNWWKISKKLTWKNQLELLEMHVRLPPNDEIQKKASAWFRVTYEPWMTYLKKKRKNQKKNSMADGERTDDRYNGFFSFAWLVYPVLLKIFQEKQDTFIIIDDGSKKKKKRKKKNVSSNNGKH